MRFQNLKATMKTAVLVTTVLLLGARLTPAQQGVNITAAPSILALPDGSQVPMWGYSCDATQPAGSTATCRNLHLGATGWSPIVITVPTGQTLQINLTNHLSFGATPNNVPTSLLIVGQLGGGLGDVTQRTTTASPSHANSQGAVTWPIVDPTTSGTSPLQGRRVQSFSTEVAAVPSTDTTTPATQLTWATPRPGTYLLESGTHPSIQGPMGLYGIVVVTAAPTASPAARGTAYPNVAYDADVNLLFSEIDPVQNNAVNAAVNTAGFSETMVWSGQPGGCGNPSSPTFGQCYPPAVNYIPLYYLINGVAFSKNNPSASLFPTTPATGLTAVTGQVLVRMVNAGLRMHVPSIVGAQTGAAVGIPPQAPAGFSLIAEDGNVLPGVPRVQSEVFMAAGKTYDVMINAPAATSTALPVFDRELSLSGNGTARDAGMLAYIDTTGAGLPSGTAAVSAVARNDGYNVFTPALACATAPCTPFSVSDPSKGLIANDTNVYGVQVLAPPAVGSVVLNPNGTFTYTPNAGATATTTDSFTYCANGTVTGTTCSSGITATVSLNACTGSCLEQASGIQVGNKTFTSNVSTTLTIKPAGVLSAPWDNCAPSVSNPCHDYDTAGYPLTVNLASVTAPSGLTLSADASGGFVASVTAAGTYTFTYKAQNSQGTVSASAATVTLIFPASSGLQVTVLDPNDKTKTPITDYRWIIEEDRTFSINPACTSNPPATGCPTAGSIVPTFGTNFHTSYMPVVATGCTGVLSCESQQTVIDSSGNHVNAICDIGNGVCRPDTTGNGKTPHDPREVHLDPTKRYYISVLPGDAANPVSGASAIGHGMGGAPIACVPTKPAVTCTALGSFPPVTVLTQPTPLQPAKLSVFVFEDDFPLNGEQDAGGGIDVLPSNEPGLGGFQITLFDDAGGSGDSTGQPTYDMFNMPLSNSLAGTIDPATGLNACPLSPTELDGFDTNDPTDPANTDPNAGQHVKGLSAAGISGMIVTCPKFESDGVTLSPLAGQAVVANLYPGRYGVVARAGADRIARGEEWLQTNTLDGQKAHDSFLRVGEPSYFQEYGPAGYHVSIGFANGAIINARHDGVCNNTDPNIPTATNCNHTVTGRVTTERMSRTPDERLYSSGSNDSFSFTQCYASLGDPDGEDFVFTKCNADGTFTLTNIPDGDWRVTIFDQWNDMLVDGLSTPVGLGPAYGLCTGSGSSAGTCNLGDVAMNQWQANLYTRTFFDQNGDGVSNVDLNGNPLEPGLTLVPTNIRFRDGSYSNFNNTDLNGFAGFNEVFPLFSWYVVETDTTRYKSTGTHVVYDAGGPADGTPGGGTSAIGNFMANTREDVNLPANLRVPGAVYCANADCTGSSILTGPITGGSSGPAIGGPNSVSTGRIDPPWIPAEGWQGFSGQNSFIEFGKKPYAVGENGGIRGHVIYASTRPFDDPSLLLQLSWEPMVPGVTINLYQESTAPDGTPALKLVDTTKTSSFDDWAQGFRSDDIPNMNCPNQGRDTGTDADLFFFTLFNQPTWLDFYNSQHGGPTPRALPNNAQFKCYDGMHNWNQVQPAPYDGMYQFPSVTGMDPVTGKPTGTNCTICTPNPSTNISTDPNYDPYRTGQPMLPAGKYVVEVVVPPGYELVKEEDKNILIGDTYVAPVVQEFAGLGNIYIIPDQAAVSATYNANNPQNPTTDLGAQPRHEGDTGSVETFWPCVGQARVVPDYISLFPQSLEVSPFAGAVRNLCDRKEVTLDDQTSALAKFYIFSSTHVAAHYTGVITDDFTSEFDPFSPQFGEKFSPPNLPISIKDFAGNEIARTYTDQWGTFDGLNYSTWEVNPPNPTGYAPQMMVTCMNDPGSDPANPDPLFNPEYSQFCYEIPFMPGQTQYMDTPVVPTSAFASAGYNNPDCSYPDGTPAIKEVDGDGIGPWVSAAGHTLTITALGDQTVQNNAYSGPSATTAPFNAKTVSRHYGFGPRPSTCPAGGACQNAKIAGVPMTNVTTWTDSSITGRVPNLSTAQSACKLFQQTTPASVGASMRCGELVITAANGKSSIDTVTVTIGGLASGQHPTHVPTDQPTIQAAIDNANPGDLIIVNPGVYNEIVLMWKPVRLQGVGAASSVINANTHPAGKLDPWRAQVNCLFGLSLNGQPFNPPSTTDPTQGQNPLLDGGKPNPFDPSGTFSCGGWPGFKGGANNPQVDRLPLEGIVGWDTTVNGNLAELLQEPSLMGAYEGAGITVLAKGVRFPAGVEVFGTGNDSGTIPTESQMPLGTIQLSGSGADCTDFPSNFRCNPSRIDGLSITDSSQGGGGIFVHAWAHSLEVSNNRIYNNAGTMSGGINVGQGESPDALLVGNNGDPVGFDQQPWTCNDLVPGAVSADGTQNVSPLGTIPSSELPFCYNIKVNVHNNAITRNSSIGDELFSSTPAGGGGVTFCVGSDNYLFNFNWLCGNLSSGDGGGLVHLGYSQNGDIEYNSILFNQSTNPTIPTNGGGIIVMSTAPDGLSPTGAECGSVTDVDCAPQLGDGTGPGLNINANLLLGNGAESGSGGGLRLQGVNGTEVTRFPLLPDLWYSVNVTNNIIVNNVAGWDGGGVSLQDSLKVNFINNTIMSNDTTASSGVLFNTLGAPESSAPGDPNQTTSTTTSAPQAAGLVTMRNSSNLTSALSALPVTVVCPLGHGFADGSCRTYSVPILYNDIFWQNRSFRIGVGALGTGGTSQQHVVALYESFTGTPGTQAPSQPTADATLANGNGFIITGGTGACTPVNTAAPNYWDIGVRGDSGPTNHGSGLTLAPLSSILTSGYTGVGTHNSNSNPAVLSQYCNGSRTPPEFQSLGYQVPPGISDATVPNPIFNLTPAATVDEGNNWINISWGPLSLGNEVNHSTLGNYAPAFGSPAIDYISLLNSPLTFALAPTTDFFGNPRPKTPANPVDAGAVEFQRGTRPALTSISPTSGVRGASVNVTLAGTFLGGATAINVSGGGVSVSNLVVVNDTTVTATFNIAANAGLSARNVTIVTPAGTSPVNPAVTFTVTAPATPTVSSITPNSGARGTSALSVTLVGAHLTGTSAINVPGGGVSVSGITVVDDSHVTATFSIASNAALGVRNVTVTTAAIAPSNAVTFTVTGPTLTSISPNTGARGTSVVVTLTGTDLSGATAVHFTGSGVSASGIQVVNDTSVTANVTITAGAAIGSRNVTVTTPNGTTTGVVTFTVN